MGLAREGWVRLVFWTLIGTALVMGCFMAIQPAINGQLRWLIGSPAQAALISTTVSSISLFLFVFVVQRQTWGGNGAISDAPWWVWTGGLLGAVYVAASLVLVARLGGAVAFSLVVLGQMVTALIMDHFGWFGVAQHDLSLSRIVGVVMVVGGVALIRLF
jgi:bacterial/archaeal transporter family-2 protein